jgi:hypothetical protein
VEIRLRTTGVLHGKTKHACEKASETGQKGKEETIRQFAGKGRITRWERSIATVSCINFSMQPEGEMQRYGLEVTLLFNLEYP